MANHVSNCGAIVNPTIPTYMHTVLTEVLVTIMKCTQSKLGIKKPRQRETIIRTAADTEILLPFAQDPDQASTAASPDNEQDLLGREEALRTDE